MIESLYRGRHVVSADNFSYELKERIFKDTRLIKEILEHPYGRMRLKETFVKTYFFNGGEDVYYQEPILFRILLWEASTRTVGSFEDAAFSGGGKCITTYDAGKFSSVAKGATIRDTIRTLGKRCRFIIIRHDEKEEKNAIINAADTCEDYGLNVSIINAGDGNNEHPTQMLIDLYAVWESRNEEFLKGNLTYGIVGDLKDSRTIHSLLLGLNDYGAKRVFLISSENNNLPPWLTEKTSLPLEKTTSIEEKASEIDIWYFTRYQSERKEKDNPFFEISKYSWWYGITDDKRDLMKPNAVILHPLPHGPEFPQKIDLEDERFVHRIQADNGHPLRMALLRIMLEDDDDVDFVDLESTKREIEALESRKEWLDIREKIGL